MAGISLLRTPSSLQGLQRAKAAFHLDGFELGPTFSPKLMKLLNY